MKLKNMLLLVLVIAGVLFAGCFNNTNTGDLPGSDIITKMNLPVGFAYMGIHETQVEIGTNMVNATEGVYRYEGNDIYIQIIKNDRPEALLEQYISKLKEEFKTGENPFEEITINGHKATQVKDFTILKGEQVPRYSITWANDKYMFIVGRSSDPSVARSLATATGS
ncbi:MAG TPA: hypothetical protein VIO11_10195 [Candidatus Methanoperedens sp.]